MVSHCGILVVISDNKIKIAQHCTITSRNQYLIDVLRFIKNINIVKFKHRLKDLVFLTDQEVEERREQKNFSNYSSKVLPLVYDGLVTELQDASDFAGDSYFCDMGIVIDLDNNTFELYRGLNQYPLTEQDRFNYLKCDNQFYYPIKLLKSYPLHKLPSEEEYYSLFFKLFN